MRFDTYVELLNKHINGEVSHRQRHLSQVACYQGKAVALIIWTTSSRKLIHRDEYIGWDSRTREKRLNRIATDSHSTFVADRPLTRPATASSDLAIRLLPWPGRRVTASARIMS